MKQLSIRDQVGMVQTTDARFFPYDHTGGGVLYIPRVASDRWKDIALDGGFKSIRRVAKRR